MSIFSNIFNKQQKDDEIEDTKGKTLDELYKEYYLDGDVSVNTRSAMSISTFYTCVKVISESISQIPLELYKETTDGTEKILDDPLYYLIHYKPNNFQTSYEFRELMLYQLLTNGNFYGWINWINRRTKIAEILPLLNVSVDVKNWKPIYKAIIGGTQYEIPASDILHVKGLSVDGFTGINPIEYHRKTLGLALSNTDHATSLMKNGGRPTGVLSYPAKLSDKAYENLSKSLQVLVEGKNYGKTIVAEEGAKYTPISLSNSDLQFIEVSNLTQENICSIMRVPQHMAGILRRSTNNNIEQQALEFVKYTLLPWIKRIEQVFWRDILTVSQKKQKYYISFNINSLERADINTRFSTYNIAITNGILNANEVRALEGYNDRPGGEEYLTPLNMRVTDANGNIVETTFNQGKTKTKDNKPEPSMISAEARNLLRDKYVKPFVIKANQAVIKETKDVRAAIEKHLGSKSKSDFTKWLEKYYNGFSAEVFDIFEELIKAYTKDIKAASLLDITEVDDVDLSDETDKYLKIMSLDYSENSLNQLLAIMNDAEPENMIDELNTRLDEWNNDNNKAKKLAMDKTVDIEGDMSRATWGKAAIIAGLAISYMWQTKGKSCPYCNHLKGKIVGKSGSFVENGSTIKVPEGEMKVYKSKLSSPLHKGCDCYIAPIFG